MRRTFGIARGILLGATLAAPFGAFAQPELEPALTAAEAKLAEEIRDVERLSGVHSADLFGRLQILALLYEETGDDDLAIATIERAREVVHYNQGLSSLDEAPLLSQLIRLEDKRGNAEGVWRLERQLLITAQRNPEDLRTVPLLHGVAKRRYDVLRRYRAGEPRPEVKLGCYYDKGRRLDPAVEVKSSDSCTSGSRRDAVAAMQFESATFLAEAIEILLRHEEYASEELRDLELEAVREAYLNGDDDLYGSLDVCPTTDIEQLLGLDLLESCLMPVLRSADTETPNVGGLASLVRLLAYETRSSAPPAARAGALVRVADWRLLFSTKPSETQVALDLYEQVRLLAEQDADAQAALRRLFAPDVPVVLTSFLRNPLASTNASGSADHIDIAFEITKKGDSEKVEVVERSTSVEHVGETDIVNFVKRTRFRPRMEDGRFVEMSAVRVRYYFN
jgi:hypothetical protein